MPPRGRIHEQALIGFQRAADAYERGRPDYPADAVEHLLRLLKIGPGTRVVELGAGHGQIHQGASASGAEVIAVEPVEAMRRKLGELLPAVQGVDGTAEAIPLRGWASVDAVVAAQAFHWFRAEEAVAEIHRVLTAGGGLGLIWNARDESRTMGARTYANHRGASRDRPRATNRSPGERHSIQGVSFHRCEKAEFPHVQTSVARSPRGPRRFDQLHRRAAGCRTGSGPQDRCANWSGREMGNRAESPIDLPYRTDVYTCRRI